MIPTAKNLFLSISAEGGDMVEDVCEASPALEKTQCVLEMTELWKKFYQLGTEMIITKSGRYETMPFPMKVKVVGKKYCTVWLNFDILNIEIHRKIRVNIGFEL